MGLVLYGSLGGFGGSWGCLGKLLEGSWGFLGVVNGPKSGNPVLTKRIWYTCAHGLVFLRGGVRATGLGSL